MLRTATYACLLRRELDTTPMAYLRTVRLARAHRDLLDHGPRQDTVTAVAYRWGFSSTSRFSAYYRETYGVTPKQTLRYS
jgi:AraC-like DNA-binding protein